MYVCSRTPILACPSYDHLNLDRTFDLLDNHIRTHLEMVVPTNLPLVPLTKDAEYFYYGTAPTSAVSTIQMDLGDPVSDWRT